MKSATIFEANAGTGKTTALTEFIISSVHAEIPLQKICALTFTEKAANEMLDRLRFKIAGLIADGKLQPLHMQLASRCFIGTIHAFCLQLVNRYAPQVNLPPIFEVDPQEEKFDALFENRWDEFVSSLLASQRVADQKTIQEMGLKNLRTLAERLVSSREAFLPPEDDDIDWLAEDLADMRKWKMRKGTWGGCAAGAVRDFRSHRTVLSIIAARIGGKPAYSNRLKDLLACRTDELYRAIAVLKESFVRPFLAEYHHAGNVRYDDLIVFARKLLAIRHIRREVKERYDRVLVDEMQDTDALQYEIILCLCEKKESHQDFTLHDIFNGSVDIELEPEKLFVVGDPKQSIYGFRNADLSAYQSMKQILLQKGAVEKALNVNYRSCSNLVDFSNGLAAELFPEIKPHDSEVQRHDLCENQEPADCIQLVRISSPDSDRIHLRILSEANWVARKIRELVQTGQSEFKDFGVLLRKLTNSHLYADAFSAQNIPLIVEGERFFYRSQEVIDFINLLKFLVDPQDELALAGTLRSPLFGMTDREVALFFKGYHQGAGVLHESMTGARKAMMEQLFEIRVRIHTLRPAELVELVLTKLPVLSVAGLSYGSYRNTIAPMNILRIYKQAAEMEQDPFFNLFHFVSLLTECSREGREKGQEPLSDEGLDAVRMMSIHNAKGLDFPIVFLPLTDYDTARAGWSFSEVVHDWESGLAGLKINGMTEANYLRLKYAHPAALIGDEDLDMEAEERRVLYVAATRAKRRLYICCLANGGGKNLFQWLQQTNLLLTTSEVESSASLDQQEPGPFEYKPFEPVVRSWQSVEGARGNRANPRAGSVTEEAEKLEPGEADWERISREAKRSGGTLVGLLCHGVLEKIDFAHPENLEQLLATEKGKYARNHPQKRIAAAVEESRKILRTFFGGPAAHWLNTLEIVGREVPVIHFDPQFDRVLSGKIDLLAKEGERFWIIDYKTDTSPKEIMQKRYAAQMRLYGEVIAGTLPSRPSARLLFIRTGEMIDV